MLWAISGGAGFLGLHLARRLLADGHDGAHARRRARSTTPSSSARSRSCAATSATASASRELVAGADVVVHAAAALPIQARASRSLRERRRAPRTCSRPRGTRGRRVVFISSTAVYGVPKKHPIEEDDPLVGVGSYGESKIEAEASAALRRAVETSIVRPKTFIGPERLGVFEILFDWIREGRRIYDPRQGHNRYQLLAVEDLVDAIVPPRRGRRRRRDVQRRRDRVRHRARRPAGADRPRRLGSRLQPVPARPAEIALRALELCASRRSRSGTTRPRTRIRSSTSRRRERVLGWQPRLSNEEALMRDVRLVPRKPRHASAGAGVTHRVPWNQQALGLLKRLS